MATIAQYIAEINHQRDLLAGHLVSRGIIATADEKLNLLVQKVGLIPSGSSTEKTIVYDANHKEGIYLSYNDVVYGLSDFVTEHSAFCSEKNNYALNYGTDVFGWDYSCYSCSTTPLKITSASQIAIRFHAYSTETGIMRLVKSDTGTASDILDRKSVV